MSFREQLAFGKIGEGRIAKWLIDQKYSVLPIYEQELQTGKGPVLYSTSGCLIAPDLLAYHRKDVKWIEAKTKSSFSWHRISQKWVTGIDLAHYRDYLKVASTSPWPIWILFLHLDPRGAKDTPKHQLGKSPIGLFGNELSFLAEHENHRHSNWGPSGMVYWAVHNLHLLAKVCEVPEKQMEE